MAIIQVQVLSGPDRESYQRFLNSSPYGHFMQTWEWGEVKRLTDWTPIRMGAYREGNLVGVMSLLERNLPYVNRPLIYIPAGPCADYREDPGVVEALYEAAADYGRKRRAVFLKTDPTVPKDHPHIGEILSEMGFRYLDKGPNFESIQPRFVWHLPLERKTPDDLMEDFHPKTRYNIRLASRKGVEIKVGREEKDLEDFYQVLKVTASRQGFLVRGYEYYQVIFREMIQRDMARLFLSFYRGEVLGGTISFITGDHCWYVYGASSNRHRNVMPNYLLQWEMINWALERGCSVYDFRGVSGDMDPDNPLYGLYRFKRGFGGHMVEYMGEHDLPLSPVLYLLSTRAEPLYRRMRGLASRGRGK